jgi:hypothetical protein
MAYVVDMFRNAAEPKGRDRFSCPVAVWELLAEIGETFGWRPTGTTYIQPVHSKVESPARRNYQPGNAQDHKRVHAEDAAAWAAALVKAKQSPHFTAMLRSRATTAVPSNAAAAELLPAMLDEFIEFAYGGGFAFAILESADARS